MMSSESCASVHESVNSEDLSNTRPDIASFTTLLGSLMESQREMSKKLELVNHDNYFVMDYLVRVNSVN